MVKSSDPRLSVERPPSVLVVDDEPGFCDVVAAILERWQYAVTRAHSVSEAVTALQTRTPDLMLIDIMMPEIDGLALVRTLASDPAWLSSRIIVMSALSQPSNINSAWMSGAEAFLRKPFLEEELLAVVEHVLGVERTTDD